jgi:hypothetical protein
MTVSASRLVSPIVAVLVAQVVAFGQGTVPGVPGGPGSGGTVLPPCPGGGSAVDYYALAQAQKEFAIATAAETSRQNGQDSIRRLLTNMSRRIGRGFTTLRFRQLPAAGPVLHDSELITEFSYGELSRTDEDVRGYSTEEDVTVNTHIGQIGTAGLTLNSSRTRYRGALGTETNTFGADAYANVELTKHLSSGLFATGSHVDIDEIADGVGASYGGGTTLSAWQGFGTLDITGTVALVKTFQEVGVNEQDTLFTSLLDVQKTWTDTFSTSVYAFYSDSLRDHSRLDGDRTFCSVGLDLIYSPTDRLGFTIGGEKTLSLNDLRDYRINTGVLLSW